MPDRARILIAEDDEGVRKMLETCLGRDYDIVSAVSGYQALAASMKSNLAIDLIVTDLDMPGLSGIELIENLLEATPVIVISAYLDNPDFKKALDRLEPVAVIRKPFSVNGLREAVRNAIGPRENASAH